MRVRHLPWLCQSCSDCPSIPSSRMAVFLRLLRASDPLASRYALLRSPGTSSTSFISGDLCAAAGGAGSRTRAEVEAKSLAPVPRVGDCGGERAGRLGAGRGEDCDRLEAIDGRDGLGGRVD